MPFDVVTHIWDVFLYKGWSIVLQVIIALFKIYESMQLLSFAPFLFMIEEILGTDDEEELRDFSHYIRLIFSSCPKPRKVTSIVCFLEIKFLIFV